MKTLMFKSLVSVCLSCLLWLSSISFLPAFALPSLSNRTSDPLPSWNAGTNKDSIIQFVANVTNPKFSGFVPVKDRIAVFDNDGTLWAEKPCYFQEIYIYDRLGSSEACSLPEGEGNAENVLKTQSVDNYREEVRSFLNNNHPDFNQPYINLTYEPMIELVQYLQANDFSVYICSGGGIDFVRAFADEAYGIPNQNVIGSALVNQYSDSNRTVQRSDKDDLGILDSLIALRTYDKDAPYPDGYPTTPSARQPAIVNPFNDYEGKAVGIERYLGKKPIMAVGNSNGDFYMFDYTDSNEQYNTQIVLLNHDDGCASGAFNNSCEYTYNNDSSLDSEGEFCHDQAHCSLAVAENRENWLVVSMETDFEHIFKPFSS